MTSIPLDYSGYGPTGAGGASTAQSMREQQMNRFRSDRGASAAAYTDSYVRAAMDKYMKRLVADGNSPDEARRAAFQSRGGQIARDGLMALRASGQFGYGDPRRYARNISEGVAGGGFQVSFAGSSGGRSVHGRGQVSGQGALAERVSMGFQSSLMKNLYGDGVADPRKLHGFDATEASGIFKTLARRGAIGNIATVNRNASVADRLAAARDGAVNESFKHALGSVKLTGRGDAADLEALTKVMEAEKDPALKREYEKVIKSTDAVVLNDKGAKKIAESIKEITKGMAALSDIYGELSGEELHSKLEEISGMQVNTTGEARRATAMVNRLRGAALISGQDPRAYMETSAVLQSQLSGQVMQAAGFDARTSTQNAAVTAAVSAQIMEDSTISAKQSQSAAARLQAHGIDVEGKDAMELYEDKKQGSLRFMDQYKAVAMSEGGMHNFDGEQKARVKGLMEEFYKTNELTDAQEQIDQRAEITGKLEAEWMKKTGKNTFGAASATENAKNALSNAYEDQTMLGKLEGARMAGMETELGMQPLVDKVGEKHALQLHRKVGAGGMAEMLDNIANNAEGFSGEDRLQAHRNILSDAGLTGGEVDEFMSKFFDDQGRSRDPEAFKNTARILHESNTEGDNSALARKRRGTERLDGFGANSNITRLRADGKAMDAQGMLTALLTGDLAGFNDADSLARGIEAFADEDLSYSVVGPDGKMVTKSAKDAVATGMDFSKGVKKDDLEKIERLHGKKLDLHTKLGFENQEAMLAASEADDGVTANMLATLSTDDAYTNFKLGGDKHNVTAITTEAEDAMLKSGKFDKDRRRDAAGLLINQEFRSKNKNLKDDMSLVSSDFNVAMLAGDKFEGTAGRWFGDGPKRNQMGEGLGRLMDFSGLVNRADEDTMKSLATVDEDGTVTKYIENQIAELRKDTTGRTDYKDAGGNDITATTEATLKGLEETLKKLQETKDKENGVQVVEEMTVGTFRVTNLTAENYSPPK